VFLLLRQEQNQLGPCCTEIHWLTTGCTDSGAVENNDHRADHVYHLQDFPPVICDPAPGSTDCRHNGALHEKPTP
ncbi:MAG: hypothetical protein CMJ62_01595, partial [Planctomycetaceae bacterium]|nr:hypothetical protein [Planctomycetaceae bacterium]